MCSIACWRTRSSARCCSQIRIFFDDTYTEGFLGRNELLNYGVTSVQQFVREHPDKLSDARETLQLISTQKASADEINMEKISKGFMKDLKNVRTGIREKQPTTPTATHDAMAVIQANIADKPRSQVTPDDMTDAIMAVMDSKCALQPGPRNMIRRFVRWFMRALRRFETQSSEYAVSGTSELGSRVG